MVSYKNMGIPGLNFSYAVTRTEIVRLVKALRLQKGSRSLKFDFSR